MRHQGHLSHKGTSLALLSRSQLLVTVVLDYRTFKKIFYLVCERSIDLSVKHFSHSFGLASLSDRGFM